jgi:hypothetical protein
MSSGISGKTPQYGFNLISFDYPRWGTFEHENWRMLDAILQGSLVSPAGAWRNSTSYPLGARVIDVINYNTYAAGVAHTSSATGTFAEERAAFPTRWTQVLNAPVYRGPWAPATAYNYLDIISQPTGEFYIAKAAHTSGGTFDSAYWVQTSVASTAWDSISGKPADVRLNFINATTIRLDGIKTNKLSINGLDRAVPTTGPTLVPAGLAVGTLYYIYAYWTGSVVSIEASTTGHVTHTNGIEVKAGDPSRTLVGMAYPFTGTVWSFSSRNYLVRSFYNRRSVGITSLHATSYGGITTTTLAQPGGGPENINFLAWDDESAMVSCPTNVFNNTPNALVNLQARITTPGIGVDVTGTMVSSASSVSNSITALTPSAATRCGEGLHTASIWTSVSSGVGTLNGGAVNVLIA